VNTPKVNYFQPEELEEHDVEKEVYVQEHMYSEGDDQLLEQAWVSLAADEDLDHSREYVGMH
jgi:hypothetical protein